MNVAGMDIVLRDVDEFLAQRIRRLAEARGWALSEALLYLLEQGLHVYEGETPGFDSEEVDVLQEALAALQSVPDDPGYALIGRIDDTQK